VVNGSHHFYVELIPIPITMEEATKRRMRGVEGSGGDPLGVVNTKASINNFMNQ
jgi:hypothetical protein